MELAALTVSGIGLFLFFLSFFFKDRSKANEQEIEEISMNIYQELYQLKKRVKIVEEEMMVDTNFVTTKVDSKQKQESNKPINEIILNQVLSLHKKGVSLDQIVNLSALSKEEVNKIIESRS